MSKQETSVLEKYKDRLNHLTVSEKVNYPQLLLMEMFNAQNYHGTPMYPHVVMHLKTEIPDDLQTPEFKQELEEIEQNLAKQFKECNRRNQVALERGEYDPSEEDPPYEVNLDSYYEDIEHAIWNLLQSLGMLGKQTVKEVMPDEDASTPIPERMEVDTKRT